MAEELGKIEKLDIEQFGLRKLYVYRCCFPAPTHQRIIKRS